QEQEQEEENTLGHGSATPPESDDSSDDETPPKKNAYPDDFEQAWSIYPKRAGGNSKADACKAWNARVNSGATAQELLNGTQRYADFVKATGKLNTEYVKQAATFFGPSKHYEEAWEVTASSGMRDLNTISRPDKTIPTGFRG
ncbi:TPA: hypothetical protein MD433_004180, partial [Citrobacter freundii]|nr:hypothetical protein [Citrobacter freundii]